MRILILMCCYLVVLISAEPVSDYDNETYSLKYILTEPSPGIYVKEDLTARSMYRAGFSDIKIYIHTRNTDRNGIQISLKNPRIIKERDFNISKENIFIVHGWNNDKRSKISKVITKAYLTAEDVNVFVVDWGKLANDRYAKAHFNVQTLGEMLGRFIGNFTSSAGLDLGKTVLIGHSLGAHIAGVAGATLQGAVDRIIGLDPAGPLFTIKKTKNRISRNSGKFVQIVHTNAGLLGWNQALGHADYWPNGGRRQPGCGTDITGMCAHSRAYKYLEESLMGGKFYSRICENWETYERGSCANGKKSYLGQYSIDKSASGNYYLETNANSPFAKGD